MAYVREYQLKPRPPLAPCRRIKHAIYMAAVQRGHAIGSSGSYQPGRSFTMLPTPHSATHSLRRLCFTWM
jgi:hypothetical protein